MKHPGGRISGIGISTLVGGSNLNANQCFLGIYDSVSGAKIAETADVSGLFLGAGTTVNVPLSAPVDLVAGFYDVVWLFSNTAGSNPNILKITNSASAIAAGNPVGTLRAFSADTAQTSLPAVLGAKNNAGAITFVGLF
jgi:hypothetical protein